MKNRQIVIIIDDSDSIREAAQGIAGSIGSDHNYSAVVIQAKDFSGNDLLPAYAFFLGCEKPKPPSFAYIETLLQHINLAGRPSGVFSTDAKTLKYLSSLINDCETVLGEPFLAKGDAANGEKLSQWVQDILSNGKE